MRRVAVMSIASFLVSCGSSAPPSGSGPGKPETQPAAVTAAEARSFAASTDTELRRLIVAASVADWTNETDITDEHEAAAAQAGAEVMTFVTKAIKESRRFDPIMDQVDADSRRQIQLLRISGSPAPDSEAEAKELAEVSTKMDAAYSKAKVCDGPGKKCRDLQALEEVLAKSRKPAELLAAWKGWHDVAGGEVGKFYPRFVELSNIAAKGVGFADTGDMWRAAYDMPSDQFAAEVDRLWSQVEPLYRELHCYTRRRLSKRYGAKEVPPTGAIPAHLLGNMWAQSWANLYKELEPYRGVAQTDVTPALKKQKYDAVKMTKLAEGFFTSLGLDPLPPTFWARSMLAKPKGKEAVCHASAWDVEYNDDLRIKMCIRINHEDLGVLHHELGHNYYFHYYYKLPMLYQNGANDGFHEAIGDTIALSMTPAYLEKVGLIKKAVSNDKATINQQMRVALDKVAFLPFGLLVDKWRWDVFSGKVAPDAYNTRWWELRRQYQGVEAPLSREGAFDPGAKYHVPSNTPYMRYFLSTILQFQFHRALCKAAGHTGPLHECSIHGSKQAGDALRAMLALGASKPWPEALAALTGEKTMDANALIEYFAPLQAWLAEQNKGQSCGW